MKSSDDGRRPDTNESADDRRSGSEDGDAERLLESVSSHAVFMLDLDGTITTWPAPAETLYGYEPATIRGRHVSVLFADGVATGNDGPPEGFLGDATDGTVEVEHWHRRVDEEVFWGTMTVSPLDDDGPDGYAVITRDTTTTKEYERMLERQNDRLKEFTDILAHDLRNPLQIIDGQLTLYEETGDDAHIETVNETTDRMAQLVEDLLRVARQGNVVTDPEPTDLEEISRTAWQVVGAAPDVTLRYDDVRSVSTDPDRLRELFENLFRNCVDHGGTDSNVRVGPTDTGFYVEDDGPGIPDDDKDEVFDHGFTTSTDGSGYGLSVVRTIVNAHGWDVVAVDADGGGARFEITGIDFLE